MEVYWIICPACMEFVYSRARHDFATCECGLSHVDGGQGNPYTRVIADIKKLGMCPVSVWVDLHVTRDDMYDDWNSLGTVYGRLKLDELVDGMARSRMRGAQPGNTWKSRLKLWLFNIGWYQAAIWMVDRCNITENFYTFLIMAGVEHETEVKPNESDKD